MIVQWMGLLPAAVVAKRRKTIQFIVTCVTITFAQKTATFKNMQNRGRNTEYQSLYAYIINAA
jgi:hypothetical protein